MWVKTHHFPPNDSMMIAMNRSIDPKIARWIMTGLLKSCDNSPDAAGAAEAASADLGAESADLGGAGARYFRLKRSGRLKSSYGVS